MSQVTITSQSLAAPMTVLLGPDPPTVTEGYAVYEMIDRPKRKQATNWLGENALVMTISLMIDGYNEDRSIESECAAIEGLARPANETAMIAPSRIKVAGPVPHSNLEWVITAIEWQDVIYSSAGYRNRQLLVLTLTEYVELKTIINNDVKADKTVYRVTIVKKGYDLRQIAALQIGNSASWRRITDMKGKKFRDPYVKPGTRIKVPIN